VNGRVAGIDNYENKPLHQHLSDGMVYISGIPTLGGMGSLAFLGLFPFVKFS